MRKIVLALLLCSVVTMANGEIKSDTKGEKILVKTLKEVQKFKKNKNDEIKKLQEELILLKKKLLLSQYKQNKKIKVLKNKLTKSKKKILNYKQTQVKMDKKLKENQEIIKDLHFMVKHKNKVEMDEYALGQYYFNL